ncbi:MAG: helix-turn-helix domain-containing protein [Candidatus Methylacidiphilales bacterium]
MTSVGEILRNSRLGKEWTPEAASRVTKIRVPQLLALERNDFSKFAAPAYARGFVRIYARCLGLDEKAILSQLDGTYEGDDDDMFVHAPSVDYVPERISLQRTSNANEVGWKIIVIGFLVFLVIAGICIGVYMQMNHTPAKATIPGLVPSAGTTTSTSPRPPASPTATGRVPSAAPVIDTASPPSADGIPTARPATSVEVPVDTAPPAPSADGIPTARPVTDASTLPAPAPAAPAEPHTLRLTAQKNGVQITVKRTTKQGEVTESYTLSNGQFHEFKGSKFLITTSAPNATSFSWDGGQSDLINDQSSTKETYEMPPQQ